MIPTYWPEVRRGGERIVHDLGSGLTARGWAPRVLTSHPGAPSVAREEGVEVVRVRRPLVEWVARRGYEEHLTHLPFAAAALLRGDDALVHAFNPGDARAAAWWGARRRLPVVFTYLGVPRRRFLVGRRLRLEVMAGAASSADAVVAVSRYAADAFWHTLGVRARVIHPGVDLERFAPGGERAEHPTLFCPAGPDVPMKRVPLLVEAVERLRRGRSDVRLDLLAPGDAALAASLTAGRPWITLREMQNDEGLAPAYREAWVSVLASRGESFGVALAESLACGTPVVGGGEGAVGELVDRPEIGRVFAEESAEGIARALEEALELSGDPATAAACRARAEDFSIAHSIAEHEALYTELLGRHG